MNPQITAVLDPGVVSDGLLGNLTDWLHGHLFAGVLPLVMAVLVLLLIVATHLRNDYLRRNDAMIEGRRAPSRITEGELA